MDYVARHMIMAFVLVYRLSLRPILGNKCRFLPTCSDYAMQALGTFNVIKAVKMIVVRILKCNPWYKSNESYIYDSIENKVNTRVNK